MPECNRGEQILQSDGDPPTKATIEEHSSCDCHTPRDELAIHFNASIREVGLIVGGEPLRAHGTESDEGLTVGVPDAKLSVEDPSLFCRVSCRPL